MPCFPWFLRYVFLYTIFVLFVGKVRILSIVYILEFITLKVNRVYSSWIQYFRGELMNYRERIRALREDNDYTQTYIASILNVGQRTYADYELGKTRIPVESLIKLADFYNVDMNYITGLSNTIAPFPK